MPHLINETFLENGRSKIVQSANEISQFCYTKLLFQLSNKKITFPTKSSRLRYLGKELGGTRERIGRSKEKRDNLNIKR